MALGQLHAFVRRDCRTNLSNLPWHRHIGRTAKRCLMAAFTSLLVPIADASAQMTDPRRAELLRKPADEQHSYVGMWVTADGNIRHELLPNGRYDEARGSRENAYQGRYELRGTYIHYWDDTGFTADGEFVDDVLHHAGMMLHRQ